MSRALAGSKEGRVRRLLVMACALAILAAFPVGASADARAPERPVATVAGICDANLWSSGKVKKTTLIALGGTSYAVATIGTKQIKNNSVRSVDVRNGTLVSRDVKRGSLGGNAIKESALGTVPKAGRVGGKTASQLTLRCPPGLARNMDSCIEQSPRPALAWGLARVACEFAGRRLPSYQELLSFADTASGSLATGGELTAQVYPPQTPSEQVRALVLVSPGGSVDTVPNTFAGGKAFRCAGNAING